MLLQDSVSGSSTSPTRVILPSLVKPHHYDLVLAPDFSTFKFDGRVAIELVGPIQTRWIT